MKNTSLILSTVFLSTSLSIQAATYIHAGKLISAADNTIREKVTVVIDKNRITDIQQGFVNAGDDDQLIDLSDSTLMPGLIDMHTHISSQQGPGAYMERFTLNEADYSFKAVHFAGKTLQAGFTTIRNLGDSYNESVALRKAINKGLVQGPRIYTAGKSIATTGGHADPTNGRAKA